MKLSMLQIASVRIEERPFLRLTDPALAVEEVALTVRRYQPNVLFSASMWSSEEAEKIRSIAEKERPGIKTHAIPQGLQVERGPDAIVEYLLEIVPSLLDSINI
jgi:hypothetical protein